MSGPLYSADMDGTRAEARDGRIDELHAEAKAAVGYAADTLRQIADRYRLVQHEELVRLQAVTDDLRADERRKPGSASDAASSDAAAALAAEAGAEDGRRRALQLDAENLTTSAGQHQSELNRLDVALRSLERIWLFLERDDATLINDTAAVASSTELNMRIVEAQESERLRLVREVHDGPAQALSNAIFQLDYVERVIIEDPNVAAHELELLGARLRRELGDVRGFISQLRPPLLAELGLEGSIGDALETFTRADRDPGRHRHRGAAARDSVKRPRRSPCGSSRRPSRTSASTPPPRAVSVATRIEGLRLGPRGPRRWARLRHRLDGRPRAAQLRAAIHARASRAGRCSF